MEPRERRRELSAVAIAFVAHAALIVIATHTADLVAAWRLASGPRVEEPAPPEDVIDLEVREVDSPAPAPKKDEPDSAPPEIAPAPAMGRGGRLSTAELPPPPTPELVPPGGATASVPGPAAPAKVPEYGATEGVPILSGQGLGTGLLGAPVWAIAGGMPSEGGGAEGGVPDVKVPVGPVASTAPNKATIALRQELRAHDAGLGLGNPGATIVQGAVESAVRGSSMRDGTAVVSARVGADGSLVGLTVASFTIGDAKAWSAIAQAASAAIGKRKLGIAGIGPKGAVVRVQVRIVTSHPSGGGAADTGPKEGILPRIARTIAEGPDRTVAPAPSPDGDACVPDRHSDLPPLCGVGMTVGGFDITDAATNKHRYVRASYSIRVLDEEPR